MTIPASNSTMALALQQFAQRRLLAAEIEKIDNADLPAGSPMYFYCRHCGIPTEVLPEDYVFPPMRECSQCQVEERGIAGGGTTMNVNGWNCQVIEGNSPLTCPACGGSIPNPNVSNVDCCYSPVWRISTDEECEESIAKAFKIEDPFADFFICQECFTSLGQLPPVWWIQNWIEEDAKLLSREKILAMLERDSNFQEPKS